MKILSNKKINEMIKEVEDKYNSTIESIVAENKNKDAKIKQLKKINFDLDGKNQDLIKENDKLQKEIEALKINIRDAYEVKTIKESKQETKNKLVIKNSTITALNSEIKKRKPGRPKKSEISNVLETYTLPINVTKEIETTKIGDKKKKTIKVAKKIEEPKEPKKRGRKPNATK